MSIGKEDRRAVRKTLGERDIRRVLFISALENVDDGAFTRSAAVDGYVASEAERSDVDLQLLLSQRAARIEQEFERKHSIRISRLYAAGGLSPVLSALLAIVGLIAGLLSNYLDTGGTVNILFNPFLLLLSWHFLIYISMAVRATVVRGVRALVNEVRPSALFSRLSRLLELLDRMLHRFGLHGGKTTAAKAVMRAVPRYLRLRQKTFGPLTRIRLTASLNLLSLSVALGVIGGMYIRGLVQDYRFAWESTFITDPATVRGIVGIVFSPVLALFNLAVPPVAEGTVAVPGAEWIHLFALSALLYIVVPRLLLAGFATLRARRLAGKLQLDLSSGHFRSIIAPYMGVGLTIFPWFYSYSPDEERISNIKRLLQRCFGDKAVLADAEEIAWGGSLPDAIHDVKRAAIATVFNGAQTPEEEIHGEFLVELRRLIEKSGTVESALVIIDSASVAEERSADREQLWQLTVEKAGIERFAWVSLAGKSPQADDFERAGRAVWSAGP